MNLLTQNKRFNPLNEIIKSMRLRPKNLNAVLNAIIYYEMVMDNFYAISSNKSNSFYKRGLKVSILNLNKYITEVIEADKNTLEEQKDGFINMREQTEQILSEEEIFTNNIALLKFPSNNVLNSMAISFNENPEFVSSIVRKVMKNFKEDSKPLTTKEREVLRLMEYAVNLVFLREFVRQIQYHTWDNDKIIGLVNKVLVELENLLKIHAKIFFKNGEDKNLIQKYESIADFLKETNVKQRTSISQLIDAWRMDHKSIEGTIKK